MSDKSYVSLARELCIICNKEYDVNMLLFDRRLRNSMNQHTVIGPGICSKCGDENEGKERIILIGFDPLKSDFKEGKLKDPYRTGEVVAIRQETFAEIFPTVKYRTTESGYKWICCEQTVILELIQRAKAANENSQPGDQDKGDTVR